MKILVNVYGAFDVTICTVVVSIDGLMLVGNRYIDGKYTQHKIYIPVKPSSFTDSKVLFQTIDEDAQEV